MNGAAAQVRGIERAGAWRLLATWVVLLAFALQSYVTQTHVHPSPAPAEAVSQMSVPAVPAGDDTTLCSLCQAIAAAGAFFSPAAVVVALPAVLAQATAAPPAGRSLAAAAASFSWRSRAPPQS
jgi:hypothetical protein